MKSFLRVMLLCIAYLAFAVSRAAAAPPGTASEKHDSSPAEEGASIEHAIVIHAADENSGVKAEYSYLASHFPGYHLLSQSFAKHNGKAYDLMTFTSADGKKRVLYFDISEYFGKS